MKTVVILGATGRFGAAAVRAFANAGWRVLAQARQAPAHLPAAALWLPAPLQDTAALQAAAAGAQVVVHAINPPYSAWHTQALPLAGLGMELAQRLGALFMLPGNVYNYGVGMPALLQPDTLQRPSSAKGRLRCEMEAHMAQRARAGLRSVVIRAGDFFGSGRGSWFDRVVVRSLVNSLRRGKLVYPGPLDVAHAWAYVPDLARAFVALAECELRQRVALGDSPRGQFERLHFAGHTLTGRELLAGLEEAAAALGLRPARGFRQAGLPWGVMRLGSHWINSWREVVEMAYLWQVPHALDGGALRAALGSPASGVAHTALPQALLASLCELGFADAPTLLVDKNQKVTP